MTGASDERVASSCFLCGAPAAMATDGKSELVECSRDWTHVFLAPPRVEHDKPPGGDPPTK